MFARNNITIQTHYIYSLWKCNVRLLSLENKRLYNIEEYKC